MGSKRRIWLPDVLPSSCSKFLSLPRPSCLSFILFSPLHALFAALQGCSSGQALSPGMRDAMWAARLASEPDCCCQVVLLCQGNTESGFAAVTCWHGWQATSNSRAPVYIFYNTRQWPNSWILWDQQDFAHCSAIFQHQYPPSIYPPQKSCLTEVELSTFACFLSCGQLILWSVSQERELSSVGNVELVYLCRHVQDRRAAAKYTTFLPASAHSTCCAITGHW